MHIGCPPATGRRPPDVRAVNPDGTDRSPSRGSQVSRFRNAPARRDDAFASADRHDRQTRTLSTLRDVVSSHPGPRPRRPGRCRSRARRPATGRRSASAGRPAQDRPPHCRPVRAEPRRVELPTLRPRIGRGPELRPRALERRHPRPRRHRLEERAPPSRRPLAHRPRLQVGVRQPRVRDQALRRDPGAGELLLQPQPEVEVGHLRLRVRRPRPVVPPSCAGRPGPATGPGAAPCSSPSPPARPAPPSSAGSRCAVNAQCPRWSTPSCISNPSTVVRCGIAITPALFTRRSTRSCPASTFSRSSRHHRQVAEVQRHDLERRRRVPLARIRASAAAVFDGSRAARTTCAPAPASASAVWNPSPPFAPVTTAVRPARSGMSVSVQAMRRSSRTWSASTQAGPRP